VKLGLLLFVAYMATIPAANWMIVNVGTVCIPDGPCLVPVAPGILAPSGVVLAGLALVLRDLVQRTMGLRWSILAVTIGAVLSFALSSADVVTASVVAFTVSELADLSVYTPLQKRGLVSAVLVSSLVGIVIDSVVFLWLAFGSLEHLEGQIIGKFWAVAFAVVIISVLRRSFSPAVPSPGVTSAQNPDQ
jgi:hypothetical protein